MIILIEPDQLHVSEIAKAVQAVDSKMQFAHFDSTALFEKWLAQDQDHTPEKNPSLVKLIIFGETLDLSIQKEQKLSIPQFDSWIQSIQKKCTSKELQVLVSFFSTNEKEFKAWTEVKGVFNLIQKPYDEMILKQNLRLALGMDSSKGSDLYTMKIASLIEALKPVQMFGISEVGFLTESDRSLPMSKVTKYYSSIFTWNTVNSVFARSLDQFQDPKKNTWIVRLTWFGTIRDQLLQIRSRFPKTKPLPLPWKKNPEEKPFDVLLIGDPSPPGAGLAGTLERLFKNVKVQQYDEPPDKKIPLPQNLKLVLTSHQHLDLAVADPRLKSLPKVVLFDRDITDTEYRQYAEKAIDLIRLPPERVSLAKKIAVLCPEMILAENEEINTFLWKEELQVGQPIEIIEMSETGLVQKYERALPIGSIRKFILWQPMEVGLPVLTARCYQSGESSTPGVFINRFTFFGMTDHQIKHVRIWMRDNYIQAKQKGNS